jgi:hypothetical protein
MNSKSAILLFLDTELLAVREEGRISSWYHRKYSDKNEMEQYTKLILGFRISI